MDDLGSKDRDYFIRTAFDRILTTKIGYGKYQKRTLFFMSLVDFNDGAELIFMSFLVKIVQVEFSLGQVTLEYFSSLFYLGMYLGSVMTGQMADVWGRRPTLIISSFLQGFLALMFVFVGNTWQLITLRFLYGIIYGFSLPLSTTMYSEVTPTENRGKGIVVINSFVGIGKMYGVLMGAIILDDISHGNWRLMMALSAVPCFAVFVYTWKYLQESPRFLIANHKYREGASAMDQIINVNKGVGNDRITQDDLQELTEWSKVTFTEQDKPKVQSLFQKNNIQVTIRLWVLWFMYHSMSKGQLLILPFIIQESKNQGFMTMFTAVLGEIPAMILGYFIIDKQEFGRQKTMVIFFALSALTNFTAYLDIFFSLSLMISRFCFRTVSSMIYAYTTEIYKTNYRTIGIGWASSMGRIGSFLMPFIVIPLFYLQPLSPFLAFTVFSIASVYASYTLPFDTTNKNLDSKELEEKQNLDEDHG